jgi:hypothetical protein
MPPKAGDRVTTDRRDAGQLARLARSGALTAVSGPTGEEAAIRDRSRARVESPRRSPGRPVPAHSLLPPARSPLHGPGPLAPSPSPVARGRGRPHSGATHGLASIGPRGPRTPGTPATSRTSTPRAGHILAPPPGGRSAAGPARGAVPRGRHPRGRTRRPHPLCTPQRTQAMLGTAPRGRFPGGAPPPRGADHSRPHAGSSRARCRGRGVPLPRQGESASPTATGNATDNPPGHPREGPSPAVQALPQTAHPRHTCSPAGGGQCS